MEAIVLVALESRLETKLCGVILIEYNDAQ